MRIPEINIADYDYNLPAERIAKYPLEKRDHSKLLVYDKGKISQDFFYNIATYLEQDSYLAANNSKVIPARLIFHKPTGAKIEIFCLEPYGTHEFSTVFSSLGTVTWKTIVGNAKKWKTGTLTKQIKHNGKEFQLTAHKKQDLGGGSFIIRFEWDADVTFAEVIELAGKVPIPPYLGRDTESIDKDRYQTVYAKHDGSVAAPTAGLHFTPDVFDSLKKKNIKTLELTLHVSAGTFKPVDADDIRQHKMHEEWIVLHQNTIKDLLAAENLTSVGTTTLRALESIYWLGINIKNKTGALRVTQWQPYEQKASLSFKAALEEIGNYMNKNNLATLNFPTEIIIMPGYRVKSANTLITNFHQPKSTLLLLVAALIGDDWKKVYKYALDNGFRFLSYGDSSILKFDNYGK